MARVIVWSQRASEDLEDIAAYIAQDSERYASIVIRKILRKTRILAEFPFVGRTVPEFEDDSFRELFAYSYRIIYEVTETNINIAAIFHGRRLLDLSLKP